MSRIHLHVWYRLPATNAGAALLAVRDLHRRMSGETVPRLLRRADDDGVEATWMEVYPDVDAAFEARLDEAVVASGLAPLLSGPRQVERFVDID